MARDGRVFRFYEFVGTEKLVKLLRRNATSSVLNSYLHKIFVMFVFFGINSYIAFCRMLQRIVNQISKKNLYQNFIAANAAWRGTEKTISPSHSARLFLL